VNTQRFFLNPQFAAYYTSATSDDDRRSSKFTIPFASSEMDEAEEHSASNYRKGPTKPSPINPKPNQ
jgi:hypothetical protein